MAVCVSVVVLLGGIISPGEWTVASSGRALPGGQIPVLKKEPLNFDRHLEW
jgi:hypothetical protein